MIGIIATWRMSLAGLREGLALLKNGGSAADAAERAVSAVERDPAFSSVGYGGLPARYGRVRLDAGWMDGDTLRIGAVMDAGEIFSPVRAARLLCGRRTDCVLAGAGAEAFARGAGLEMRDMLTDEAREKWRAALKEQPAGTVPEAYRGHDTVCVLALDERGGMVSAVSTSGLFMKEPGRVGDSPLPGCGFYCDSRFGAAAATGLGEDVMRGCLSYETVSLMRRGLSPAEAAARALGDLTGRFRALGEGEHSISLIALAPDGTSGAATTLPVFPFTLGDDRVRLLTVDREGRTAEHPSFTCPGDA